MREEKLMSAIGLIDDRYIMESSVVKPIIYKRRSFSISAIAACLCLVLSVTVAMFMKYNDSNNFIYTFDGESHFFYWGKVDDNVDSYIDKAEKGKIVITDLLREAVEENGKDTVYAVIITDANGASAEVVFENYIWPLLVDYKISGGSSVREDLILITGEQIEALEASYDFAFILSLANEKNK